MAATIEDLKGWFAEAVAAFNTNKIENLQGYLDDQVIVYSIKTHGRYKGALAVAFLTQEFADKPQFMFPPNATYDPPSGAAAQATISGNTTWTDSHGSEPLQFNFTCVYKKTWLFSKLWAA